MKLFPQKRPLQVTAKKSFKASKRRAMMPRSVIKVFTLQTGLLI